MIRLALTLALITLPGCTNPGAPWFLRRSLYVSDPVVVATPEPAPPAARKVKPTPPAEKQPISRVDKVAPKAKPKQPVLEPRARKKSPLDSRGSRGGLVSSGSRGGLVSSGSRGGPVNRGSTPPAALRRAVDRLGDPLPHGAIARLGAVRFHTDESLNSIVFLADGKRFVTGGLDGFLRTWDLETGHQVGGYQIPDLWIGRSLALSADGTYLAVTTRDPKYMEKRGWDKTIRIWRVGSTERPRLMEGHSGRVSCVAYSPDGKFLASGGDDATARLWHATTLKELRRFVDYQGNVTALAFSPNGGLLAVAVETDEVRDGTIWLHRMPTGEVIGPLEGHGDTIKTVSFTPDGDRLVSASVDGTLRVWDVRLRKSLRVIDAGFSHTDSINVLPGVDRVACWTFTNLRIYELATSNLEMEQKLSLGGVFSATALSPDGALLAQTGWDGAIRFFSTETGKPITPFGGHETTVSRFGLDPEGHSVWTQAIWGGGSVWNVETQNIVMRLDDGSFLLGFTDGDKTLVTLQESDRPKTLRFHAIDGQRVVRKIQSPAEGSRICLSARGNLLAIVDMDLSDCAPVVFRVWTLGDNNVELVIRNESKGTAEALCFSKSENRVAVSYSCRPSSASSTEVWDTTRGALVLRVPAFSSNLSVEGSLLALGNGGEVSIWDTRNGNRLIQERLFADRKHPQITAVALSPTENLLAVAERNSNAFILWNLSNGRRRKVIVPGQWVSQFEFTANGQRLATLAEDDCVLVWDIDRIRP